MAWEEREAWSQPRECRNWTASPTLGFEMEHFDTFLALDFNGFGPV